MDFKDMTLEELIKLKQKLENDLEKCYEMKHNIYKKIEELIYFKIPPLATNGIIDLRKPREHPLEEQNDNNLIGHYEIFLHNTNISVGGIDYRGYHFHEYFADVGGEIIKEYRGNGYLYQALSLLKELLSKKGVDDFWASANENNIPSIKTIKKLGGILLDSKSGTELYKVPTKKIELEEVSNKKI